jgi:arylsulfatase A-like enzyme
VEAREHLTLGAVWRACAGGFDVPDGALERMRALYAASVRLLDDWLERLLTDLDDRGILDETIVIVTADHGENFGEGGLMGHAYSLDQRLTRLPLVAAGPFEQPDGVVSLASLPALLAEAAGLEVHPYGQAAGEPAAAIAQFDPPAAAGDPRVAKALDVWGLPDSSAALITAPLRSATDGRWKLLRRGEKEQLFDLETDELELHPIDPAADAPDGAPVAALREALEAADAAAVAPAPAAPAGSEEGGGVPPAAAEIDDEERAALEERMKLLGYM